MRRPKEGPSRTKILRASGLSPVDDSKSVGSYRSFSTSVDKQRFIENYLGLVGGHNVDGKQW